MLPLRRGTSPERYFFLAAATCSAYNYNPCHLAHPAGGGRYPWDRGFFSGGRDPNLGFLPHPPPPPPYGGQTFNPPPQQYNRGQFRSLQQFRSQRPLDYRDWEYSKPEGCPPSYHHTAQFKVLSYNLLAEYLAINHRGKLYFHIPRHILDWGWRKRSIFFELGLWSADILCFQEVDKFQDLEEDLKIRGYSGTWKMRTGDPIDGCAIFWRVSRFRLLHEECIEYNKLGLRNNVAQICVFQLLNQNNESSESPGRLSSSKKVVICNIHVLYNPRRGEIKLGQVRVLLDRAHAVSKHWDNAPVVLCGDFNCTPESPLYNYISEQKLDLSVLPRDRVSGQASAEIRPQWQFNPNVRPPQSVDFRGGVTQTASSGEMGHLGYFNVHKERSSGQEDCANERVVSSREMSIGKTHHEVEDCEDEAKPASSVSGSSPKEIFPDLTMETSYTNNREDENPLIAMCGSGNLPSVHVSNNADVPKTSSEVTVSTESGLNVVLREKMEDLSLDELDKHNEGDMGLGEDSATFLAELHDGNASVSQDRESVPVNIVFNTYDPSAWTPMEIESATGSSYCTLMEHSLKLKSSYTEVEDISGTRDSHGEPLVTSYNRCFLGTVDYIWRSEGLKTVRVLAPIPKKAMLWTPGFPTKKWGSDHIALVSELAFTSDLLT